MKRAYKVEFGVPDEIQEQVDTLLKQTQTSSVLLLAILESPHYAGDDNLHTHITRALAEAFHARNAPYDREFSALLEGFGEDVEKQLAV